MAEGRCPYLPSHVEATVQGVCRVRVGEMGFGEVAADAPVVADEREWG